jgi:hypothetical protein
MRFLQKSIFKCLSERDHLALEITLILVVKIILIWALWALCFSNPIPKESREAAVKQIIISPKE